ncbi:MAG: PilZ domain-containing protein [bacterium]|nr:PilZ domain-containing protein [bacterium]
MAEENNVPERRHPRIKKVNLVQVSRFDEEGFRADLATGRTLNISRGGVRIELHHPLPLRSVVGINMALGDQILEVSGTVVYLEVLDEDRCAMGIEFKELSADAGKVIGEYLGQGGT